MKSKNLHLIFLLVVTGFLLFCNGCTKDADLTKDLSSSQTVLKSGNGPVAVGQGIYHNLQGSTTHFRFNAMIKPDGSVEGNGELKYLQPQGSMVKFNIDCLAVSGNAAVMSGVATESTFSLCPAGTPVVFRAVDNGEGGSDPDQMTGLYLYLDPGWGPWDCNNFPEQELISIEQGNIQVKP